MELGIRIGDLELPNPIIIASGPPGINGAAIKRFAAEGPGAIVTKSIDLQPSPGQRLSLSYSTPNRKTVVITDLWSTYSLQDWCDLLLGPLYRGKTIRQALQVYAPASDQNNPNSYASIVLRRVAEWDQRSGEFDIPGLPVKFSRWPDRSEIAADRLGEHNEEVLRELLSLTDQEITELYADKVIVRDPLLDTLAGRQ